MHSGAMSLPVRVYVCVTWVGAQAQRLSIQFTDSSVRAAQASLCVFVGSVLECGAEITHKTAEMTRWGGCMMAGRANFLRN